MPSRTVAEMFDRIEEFTSLLAAAELNAETEWDERFTKDLATNYQRFGGRTYLSDSQLEQLERIANA